MTATRKIATALLVIITGISCTRTADNSLSYTRGIGVYPGDPDEFFGPSQVIDNDSYRNLALNRAAYHSSSYDYNCTAQLVSDGVLAGGEPYYLSISTRKGPVDKRERERWFDDNMTTIDFEGGDDAFILIDMNNACVQADEISVTGSVSCSLEAASGYSVAIEVSEDGNEWRELKRFSSKGYPGTSRYGARNGGGSQDVSVESGLRNAKRTPEQEARLMAQLKNRTFEFKAETGSDDAFSHVRVRFESECVEKWSVSEVDFFKDGSEFSILPSVTDFCSAWMSEGNENEWVYVDLGASASFDRILLHWVERSLGGSVEVSENALTWKKIADIPADGTSMDDIEVKGNGRYVRLSGLNCPEGSHIILSEMEVYGTGGPVSVEHEALLPQGNRLYLSGGNWRIQRSSLVEEYGEELSVPGFGTDSWVIATVPATVLSSFYNIGAVPDLRYDADQLYISESFFCSDFWYRDEFELPEDFKDRELVLNFDGINWKSEVYFNGEYLGHIDGAFTRGRFDVTGLAHEGTNALAVKIIRNDHPGIVKEQNRITADINGGILGADNPTMHCAIGWDWIPTVRGRNIGIWNDVFLSAYEGGVSIDDVFVDTDLPLPGLDYADLTPVVTLTNHSSDSRTAQISLSYGDLLFEQEEVLAAGETKDVEIPSQRLQNPSLWWPVGYGEPFLYDVSTSVSVDGKLSDTKTQKSGVREMSYTTDSDILDIYVNGRRLICNGGNWGYPEVNLNYRGREYDIAVAYHADMNYTMIRDWVGQTGDEEFYEACDRHGIMVWQDFWLANPYDGPDPDDNGMFMDNARDYVMKIRNHPSLAIYVGRNEGYPPQELNDGLENLVSELHPGLKYIPHSAEGLVTGNGPYRALPVEEYFLAERGKDHLHSERGMPNVMTYESMSRMLRPENQWPQNSVWGVHDFTLENAQSCATVNELIEKAFAEPKDMKQFTQWAQWVNYNGYRAMYESRSWFRKGLLIWMSHSCWPSMVWQTYDYYMEPTAAYFAVKKASAPVRIQWNPVSGQVEVVNNSAGDLSGLTAYAALVNCDGKVVHEESAGLDSHDDSTSSLMSLDLEDPSLSDVFFIKLRLTRGDSLLADNFYWEGRESGNLRQLLELPEAKLSFRYKTVSDGRITATVRNTSKVPALMLRVDLKGKKTGEQILPAFYEDNYFSLLPGEEKTIEVNYRLEDARGESPVLTLEGFNFRSES